MKHWSRTEPHPHANAMPETRIEPCANQKKEMKPIETSNQLRKQRDEAHNMHKTRYLRSDERESHRKQWSEQRTGSDGEEPDLKRRTKESEWSIRIDDGDEGPMASRIKMRKRDGGEEERNRGPIWDGGDTRRCKETQALMPEMEPWRCARQIWTGIWMVPALVNGSGLIEDGDENHHNWSQNQELDTDRKWR